MAYLPTGWPDQPHNHPQAPAHQLPGAYPRPQENPMSDVPTEDDVPTGDTEVADDGDDSTPGVPDAQQDEMPATDEPDDKK